MAAAFFLLASPMIWGRETRVNKTAKIPMYKTSLIPIFSGRIFARDPPVVPEARYKKFAPGMLRFAMTASMAMHPSRASGL